MNVLNRIVALLVLLALLAAALVTLGLVTDLLTVAEVRQVWPYGPVLTICYDVAHSGTRVRPWVLGGASGAGLLALVLLVRELTPPPRRARLLVLPGAGPGRTEMAYSTLDALAEYGARAVQGIERVRARVEPKNGTLTVRCHAVVSPYVNLATAGPELEQSIAQRLETVTGLPVQVVQVRTVVQEERARRSVR